MTTCRRKILHNACESDSAQTQTLGERQSALRPPTLLVHLHSRVGRPRCLVDGLLRGHHKAINGGQATQTTVRKALQ